MLGTRYDFLCQDFPDHNVQVNFYDMICLNKLEKVKRIIILEKYDFTYMYIHLRLYLYIYTCIYLHDMSTCNTCIDDAITQQPHVELCSQGGTSRIMQLSKWTQQRKNKNQNHKKKLHNTHLLQYFVYFCSLTSKKNKTHRIIFFTAHTQEVNGQQRICKKHHSESAKKLQVKVVFLPSGKVATMKRGVGRRFMERKTRKTHLQNGGGDLVREIPGDFRGNLGEIFSFG